MYPMRFAAFTFLIALSTGVSVTAQETPADTAGKAFGWRGQSSGLLNLSQAYYDNWAKGGTDALVWEINLGGSAALERERFLWESKAKVLYGRTKLQGLASRKSSDEWSLESIYTQKLGTWVNPFVGATGQSQFTGGFTYDDSAHTRTQISDFFDPAYFTQTAGLGITPAKDLTERLGFTMKQTVSGTYGFADDKETDGEVEEFKQEYGLSSTTDYSLALMENILAKTRLEMFANFKGWDEVDGRWANQITAKVNKLVSVNMELEFLYDKDLSEDTQTRETLAISIAFLSL